MLSAFRNRFGVPGVISVIALVFAMLGGAYAASDDGSSGKATASAKKAKKGPRGPKGPAGPAGPQGPAGPAGPKGDTGAAGSNGTNGTNGTNGVSVTSEEFAGTKEGKCAGQGGTKFSSASGSTFACNGQEGEPGEPGEEGDPWTDLGTLPVGATETGSWSIPRAPNAVAGQPTNFIAPISFAVPLAAPLAYSGDSASSKVHLIWPSGEEVEEVGGSPEGFVDPPHCPGTVEDPQADSGHLCVYLAELSEAFFSPFNSNIIRSDKTTSPFVTGAATTGALINLPNASATAGSRVASGTWAVTG